MQEFYETVDLDGRSPIADQIASCWGELQSPVKSYRASANFVFKAEGQGENHFLRFNHASERQAPQIEAELEFVNHLHNKGINVALPVGSSAGSLVETVSTPLGDFHAVMFKALPGEMRDISGFAEADYTAWGKALGKLHLAANGYTPDNRSSWSDHIGQARLHIPSTEKHALDDLATIEAKLSIYPKLPGRYGLIHYDFELDNILWAVDEIGVLDFDDCALYWYEADIAFALRDLFEDSASKVDFSNGYLLAFLSGYRTHMPLEDEAVQQIPLFLRLHNLVMLAKLLRSLGEDIPINEPDWARGLRAKLIQIADFYRLEFKEHPLNNLMESILQCKPLDQ